MPDYDPYRLPLPRRKPRNHWWKVQHNGPLVKVVMDDGYGQAVRWMVHRANGTVKVYRDCPVMAGERVPKRVPSKARPQDYLITSRLGET